MPSALRSSRPTKPRHLVLAQAASRGKESERGAPEESGRKPQPAGRSADVDLAVLRLAQSGDREALERFIRHYQDSVFAFISRSTGYGPHVEDLAQEVFLRVCRALPRFEVRDAKISTWIFQIAVRIIQDRRKKRRPLSVEIPEQLAGQQPGPELQLENQRALERVALLAEQLPENQRVALVLAEFHGLSYEEIAQVMDCAASTVKTRVFRARSQLRALYYSEEREASR